MPKTDGYALSIVVPTYKAIVYDVDKNGVQTIMNTYHVTRDGFLNLGLTENGVYKLENRAFEPAESDKDRYSGVTFAYPSESIDAIALRNERGGSSLSATQLSNNEYINGQKLSASIARSDPSTASGVMIHVGGYYQLNEGAGLQLAGTYGCFGVVDPTQVFPSKDAAKSLFFGPGESKSSSNAMNNLVRDVKMSQSRDSDKNKMVVEVEKREKVQEELEVKK